MRTFLAKWPNGTISILTAKTSEDLYDRLDQLANPEDSEIFLLPRNFSLDLESSNNEVLFDIACEEDIHTPPRKWAFPKDIFSNVFFDRKPSFANELLNDGVKRKQKIDKQKLKRNRKRNLTLKPLQVLGAMKGINELSN